MPVHKYLNQNIKNQSPDIHKLHINHEINHDKNFKELKKELVVIDQQHKLSSLSYQQAMSVLLMATSIMIFILMASGS